MLINTVSNNYLSQVNFLSSPQPNPIPSRFTVLKEGNFKFKDLFSWIPFFRSKPKDSCYKSIIDRLEKSEKHTVSEQEMEKFLNDVENGTFEKVATDKEILRATHLLINYARLGTTDSIQKETVEKDVQQLFTLDNLTFSPNRLKGEQLCCSLEHCYKKNGKKSNVFKRFGNFVKKHRKAIIITAVAVVAVAIVAVAVVAIASGAGAAGAAQGASVATGALAGVAGASQSNTKENVPTNNQTTAEPPPKIEPEVKVIPPNENESTSKIGSLIKETLTQNPPHPTVNTSTLLKTLDPKAQYQPQSKIFPENYPLQSINLKTPTINQIPDQHSTYTSGPYLNTIKAQPLYSMYQVTGVTPSQFDEIGSKMVHDVYDEWAQLKGELVKEQELARKFITKIIPNSELDSLNLITSEGQKLIANKGHEKIDGFFLSNQAGNYLPGIENPDNMVYGICPPPPGEGFFGKKGWELKNLELNKVKLQPVRNVATEINGRRYAGHALDEMQNRGFTPTIVEEVIENNVGVPNKFEGRTQFYDKFNNITVITEGNDVITVTYGTV